MLKPLHLDGYTCERKDVTFLFVCQSVTSSPGGTERNWSGMGRELKFYLGCPI